MQIIAGLYKNHRLSCPPGNLTRPTSAKLRESIFNSCSYLVEGCHFLDLFAGSGAMGLEALSRGAAHASFVEINRLAARFIKENICKLKVEKQSEMICGSALLWIEKLSRAGRQFEIIFADPPYQTFDPQAKDKRLYSEQIIMAVDHCHLLGENGILIVEEDSRHPPKVIPNHLKLIKSRQFGHSLVHFYTK